ncbi:asparagine synthase [Acrodontium crateriforme]|uniref:Asparagine synthase n=1 Tax=Acrodontium crateriforme TaxID=150365 RepID=A0AAQ3R9W2_9PEZI|nr:asparagine synthase [Acrodontium crateriforme]
MCGISTVFALTRRGYLHNPGQRKQRANDSGYNSTGTDSGSASPVSQHKDDDLVTSLDNSLGQIKHRGPDSRGQWISDDGRIALGHVRLAINDLSLDGAQPLHNDEGTIHAVVNGELYTSDEIREELARKTKYPFKSTSDSEIVLALYQEHGPSFLKFLRGEFAICLFDSATQTFFAARDRYGVKPLFYTTVDDRLLVASEAKAFIPLGWKPQWDVKCLMDEGWRQDSRTPFLGVHKVRPGHYFTCNSAGFMEHRQYWDSEYPDKAIPDLRTEGTIVSDVRERLLDSIRIRLRADVPVGVYLSGGLDSSAVAGMMCHLIQEEGVKSGGQSGLERVTCFSIAFDQNSGLDESEIARRTAEHLGVKFVPKYMNEEEIVKRFEDAVWHAEHQNYDLNFVGEGADEVFGGYPAHLRDFIRESDPSWPVSGLSNELRQYHQDLIDTKTADYYAHRALDPIDPTTRPSRIALAQLNSITSPLPMASYRFPSSMFSPWTHLVYGPSFPLNVVAANSDGRVRALMQDKWHPLHSALYCWSKGNLPNVLLACLGDRAEMAHSIEGRVPFIDHKLASFINAIPPSLKIKYNPPKPGQDASAGTFTEKWILREAARPFITDEIYYRKKHGYAAPTVWPVGGALHNMFKSLITRENVERLGFVAWDQVKCLWVVLSQKFDVQTATVSEKSR